MASTLSHVSVLYLLVCSCLTISHSKKRDYKGYKIYETQANNEQQSEALHLLQQLGRSNFDFHNLHKEPNVTNRVLVGPDYQGVFEKTLKDNFLNFTIINDDFSESIKKEQILEPRSFSIHGGGVSFRRYMRAEEINAYLNTLAKKYKKRVRVQTIGHSFEGRPLNVITISDGNRWKKKRIIFIDAGIHAREWIAPATALYVIHQLVERFEKNIELLTYLDWVIMPLVNPDGYEYSHTNDRMWRKTRKPNNIRQCPGADPNRNFDIHWGEIGSSGNECDEIFYGPAPFSEPETKAVRTILNLMKDNCMMYLSLHSYGSFILYPWTWSPDPPNANSFDEMHDIAKAGADAMKVIFHRSYRIGPAGKLLYPASGGSMDYAFAKSLIPVTLTMELPFGGSGFDPKLKEIESVAKRAWYGIRAMAEKIDEKLGPPKYTKPNNFFKTENDV